MWSVVILSPTFKTAAADIVSSSGVVTGNGLMFGPRKISRSFASSGEAGGSIILSLMTNSSGNSKRGISPKTSAGSVNTPVKADTAAVSGLTKYTPASAVPERPRKLRLKVRSEIPFEFGDCPIPMQGPQAHSKMRAPALIKSASAPFCASILNTCLEPGAIERLTSGCTVLPFKI